MIIESHRCIKMVDGGGGRVLNIFVVVCLDAVFVYGLIVLFVCLFVKSFRSFLIFDGK
jgi:hypothetical protein